MQKAVDAVIDVIYGEKTDGTTSEYRKSVATNYILEMFGRRATGDTLEDLATTASQRWVRGPEQLAKFKPGATGMLFTAKEALDLFGLKMMVEAISEGGVLFSRCLEIGKDIKTAREARGWSQEYLAFCVGFRVEVVAEVEEDKKKPNMNTLKIICDELGLDARTIGM